MMNSKNQAGGQVSPALNPFETFWSLGFRRLVPIIPPDAELSPRSSLAKRKDARGKAVGVRGRDGLWRGLDWIHYEADELDTDKWARAGAGVGIKTGEGLIAIDADTLDVTRATTIRDLTEKHFGRLPVRVGKAPKALYVIRTTEPIPYMRIEFGGNDEKPERVELLTENRQFVAHGIHPQTREPYYWPRDLHRLEDIPQVSREQLDAYMADLQRHLPQARPPQTEGGTERQVVSQEALRGDPNLVRKAVEAIPNEGDAFASRESYIQIAAAIKAALPDDEQTAFDIFHDWCAKWQDGENDENTIAADWRRIKPPYRIGAKFLYHLAQKHAPAKFSEAEVWFEDIPHDEPADNPFVDTDIYPLLRPSEIVNRPPATFLINRHIPTHATGFIYSEPGVGKSFLALDMSLHIAAGRKDWHGDTIVTGDNPAVLYIAAEGSYGFRNRIRAWCERNGTTPNQLDNFMMIERSINFMHADDVAKLARTVDAAQRNHGAQFALIVIDTVSRAMPGADENLQKDMTRFVQACDAIKTRAGATVIGVHHAGKSGDMRGSTVLLGAGDFVFRLTRKKGASIGTLTCEKQKDAEDGWSEKYQFETVALPDSQSSLTVVRVEETVGPSRTLTPGATEAIFADIQAAWDAGLPWSLAPQTGARRAIRRMVEDHGFEADAAENTLNIWLGSGMLEVALVSTDTKKRGLRVVRGAGQDVLGVGVFE